MPSLFEARSPGAARPLAAAEQQALLQYAREAIIEAVCHGNLPRILRNDGIFAERRGVFVTLHVHHRLRGCIGVVETPDDDTEPRVSDPSTSSGSSEQSRPFPRVPHPSSLKVGLVPSRDEGEPVATIEPLGTSIVRCAASAAVADPRFPPVRPDELPDLRIEISLLSPPEPIRPGQIEIGRHGLLITSVAADPSSLSKGGSSDPKSSGTPPLISKGVSASAPPSVLEGGAAIKRGLLLPQVAVEHHFTPEQFLAETCRKAGLPPDAWRLPDSSPEHAPRVQLFAFTCQVFSEAPTPVRHSERT
jgi:AMMECR1 domain-containing protein